MIDIGTTAFDAIWAAIPQSRVRIRVGSHTVERAMSTGVKYVKQRIDDPSTNESVIELHYPEALENRLDPILDGRGFELQEYGKTKWTPFEATTRMPTAGVVTIQARSLEFDLIRAFHNEVANHTQFVVVITVDSLTASGIRSDERKESDLTDMLGRKDPDTLTARFLAHEIGDVTQGKTVTIGADQYFVERVIPDASQLMVDLEMKKRRVAP